MTAQTALWISSCLGATLFFVAGFLTRLRVASASAAAALAGTRPGSAVEEPPAAAPTESDPAPSSGDSVRLQRELERARASSDAFERERDQLEAALTAQQRALAAMTRERDAARDRLRQRDHELRDLSAERDALAARVRVTAQLEEAAGRADAAELERQTLAMELEAARGKLRELEELREEADALRRRAAERDELAAEVERLRRDLQAARTRDVAERRPAPRQMPIPAAGGTGPALERLLAPLASRSGMRAAAFADELGLPIVGIGEHTHGLAAFAGLAEEVARKATSFLPVGDVRRIEIEGERRVIVSVHPSPMEEARYSLVTMSVGGLPPPELRNMLERSASLLA